MKFAFQIHAIRKFGKRAVRYEMLRPTKGKCWSGHSRGVFKRLSRLLARPNRQTQDHTSTTIVVALFGGAAGGAAGAVLGDVVDENILDNFVCLNCGFSFGKTNDQAQTAEPSFYES